jgi:hypothetical protein
VHGVRVCDRLPAGLVATSAHPKARVAKGRSCWTAKHIAAGKDRRYRLTARMLPGAQGRKLNLVTATSADARAARASRTVRMLPYRATAGGVTG